MPLPVSQKVANGAIWMVLLRLLDRSLGLLSILILVRLLEPADFGIVAIAVSILALMDAFTAFGLDTALIRNPKMTQDHLDSAWTLNIILASFVAMLMLMMT